MMHLNEHVLFYGKNTEGIHRCYVSTKEGIKTGCSFQLYGSVCVVGWFGNDDDDDGV